MKVYACSNTSCRAVFDEYLQNCPFCKEKGQPWTLITCEVNHVTKVQACRPGDRAMLSTPAGDELVWAAQKAMSDAAFAAQQVLGDPREAVTLQGVNGPPSAWHNDPNCKPKVLEWPELPDSTPGEAHE